MIFFLSALTYQTAIYIFIYVCITIESVRLFNFSDRDKKMFVYMHYVCDIIFLRKHEIKNLKMKNIK